jgi:TPR repeat protein
MASVESGRAMRGFRHLFMVALVLLAACRGSSRAREASKPPMSPLDRARAFERGSGEPRDYTTAYALYAQLCRDGAGDAEACRRQLRMLAEARGAPAGDRDALRRRYGDLARAVCERQHNAVACYVAALASGSAEAVPPAVRAELDQPRHSCEAGDVDACELALSGFDFSGSSGRKEERERAAAMGCSKDDIMLCAAVVRELTECRVQPGIERCRDQLVATWRANDDRERLAALSKLDTACAAGDADACAAIPGRELARDALCKAHDYNACAELRCLGNQVAGADAEAHGGEANCSHVENLESARKTAPPPEPVEAPPLPPFTPSDQPPFASLAFRELIESAANWPKFEIYNLGTRRVASAGRPYLGRGR